MTSHANERPFSQLLGDMLTQLSTLIQNEVDVARAELREKLSIVGGAMRLIAVGATLMIPALVLILFAVASGLKEAGMPEPLAFLCTGGGAALIAGILAWIGVSHLSGDALAPTVTLDELRRDKIVAKELVR